MASPASVRQVSYLAMIRGLVGSLEEGREFRHSPSQDGVRATQYVEIREEPSNSREIEAELGGLSYEYQWQRKHWRC